MRVELKDAWEIWFQDKYECQYRLVKRFNGFMKYCNASKKTRLQEMMDSPNALRNQIECKGAIPQAVEDKIERYENEGFKLIEKTTEIFANNDFHPLMNMKKQK